MDQASLQQVAQPLNFSLQEPLVSVHRNFLVSTHVGLTLGTTRPSQFCSDAVFPSRAKIAMYPAWQYGAYFPPPQNSGKERIWARPDHRTLSSQLFCIPQSDWNRMTNSKNAICKPPLSIRVVGMFLWARVCRASNNAICVRLPCMSLLWLFEVKKTAFDAAALSSHETTKSKLYKHMYAHVCAFLFFFLVQKDAQDILWNSIGLGIYSRRPRSIELSIWQRVT